MDRLVNGIGGVTLLNRLILAGSPLAGQRARIRLEPAPSAATPPVAKTATAGRGLLQPATAEYSPPAPGRWLPTVATHAANHQREYPPI